VNKILIFNFWWRKLCTRVYKRF